MALGSSLLILSAFLHASWNALTKSSQDKEAFLFITIFISGVLTIFLAFALDGGFYVADNTVWVIAVVSGIFEGLYFMTLTKALRDSLGTSYAIMRGGAMVLVWIISSLFLHEVSSLINYLGAGFILGGILIMSWPTKKNPTAVSSKKTSNVWAYLSAVFIAGYHLCYHQALIRKAHPTTLFTIAMFVSLPFLFWSLGRHPWSRLRQTWSQHAGRVSLTGLASMASFVIFLYGLQVSAPGYAISLRNSSIFFALIFSFLLKEKLRRLQIFGAVAVGIGTLILSL